MFYGCSLFYCYQIDIKLFLYENSVLFVHILLIWLWFLILHEYVLYKGCKTKTSNITESLDMKLDKMARTKKDDSFEDKMSLIRVLATLIDFFVVTTFLTCKFVLQPSTHYLSHL